MNDARRKEIARASAMLSEARTIIEQAQSDEQDYFDNMPESFQNGDKGNAAQEHIDNLQEALDEVESAEGKLDEIAGGAS